MPDRTGRRTDDRAETVGHDDLRSRALSQRVEHRRLHLLLERPVEVVDDVAGELADDESEDRVGERRRRAPRRESAPRSDWRPDRRAGRAVGRASERCAISWALGGAASAEADGRAAQRGVDDLVGGGSAGECRIGRAADRPGASCTTRGRAARPRAAGCRWPADTRVVGYARGRHVLAEQRMSSSCLRAGAGFCGPARARRRAVAQPSVDPSLHARSAQEYDPRKATG